MTNEEISIIIDAYPLITILIAGADGDIDVRELEWGKKLSKIRSYNENYELNPLFKEVEKDFDEKIDLVVSEAPGQVLARYDWISPKLAQLNPILAKLERADAYALYKSLTSFAKHIAKSEGGFLGMGSVNSEEMKMIKLPMVNVIAKEAIDNDQ